MTWPARKCQEAVVLCELSVRRFPWRCILSSALYSPTDSCSPTADSATACCFSLSHKADSSSQLLNYSPTADCYRYFYLINERREEGRRVKAEDTYSLLIGNKTL